MPSLNQLCADLKTYLRATSQKSLKRNINFDDIPDDDVDVLFSYFGIHLVCELYGIEFRKQVKAYTSRIREKEAIAEAKLLSEDETLFEPEDPAGIGGWQYAERLKKKVYRALEGIINQNVGTIGHSQFVQAAKTLLEQTEKTKLDAAEIMMAYESQLLILAEHLVESFLPKLGQRIKKELRDAEKTVGKKLADLMGSDNESLKVWKSEFDRVIRGFELKRYELILAETMASNKRVSEAFDFTRDLIDNYKTTSEIRIEDKGVVKLKQFIGKRE